MVGFEITNRSTLDVVTVFNEEAVFFVVLRITNGNDMEAIESSSWCGVASIGETYEHNRYYIVVVER